MPLKDSPQKISIPYSDIAALAFTGRDTAAGKSWEAWARKYWEKKAAGEKHIALEPENLDVIPSGLQAARDLLFAKGRGFSRAIALPYHCHPERSPHSLLNCHPDRRLQPEWRDLRFGGARLQPRRQPSPIVLSSRAGFSPRGICCPAYRIGSAFPSHQQNESRRTEPAGRHEPREDVSNRALRIRIADCFDAGRNDLIRCDHGPPLAVGPPDTTSICQ